jgi:hypothetical protein
MPPSTRSPTEGNAVSPITQPGRRFSASLVIVLIVAVEGCAPEVMVIAEGAMEHVAYWPGVTAVQVRATAPVKPFTGVSVSGKTAGEPLLTVADAEV